MYQLTIVIHVLLGLGIIGLILMQQGKGADAGATFGGGASGSVFGAQGAASFLSRATAISATLFFVTSLGLAWQNAHTRSPVADIMNAPAVEKEAPDLGLPNVDGANNKAVVPAIAPESKETVAVPAPATPSPVVAAPDTAVPASEPKPSSDQVPAAKVVEPVVEEKESELVEEKKPEPKAEKHEKTHHKSKVHSKKK